MKELLYPISVVFEHLKRKKLAFFPVVSLDGWGLIEPLEPLVKGMGWNNRGSN